MGFLIPLPSLLQEPTAHCQRFLLLLLYFVSLYSSWKSEPKGIGEEVRREGRARKKPSQLSLPVLALHLFLVSHFDEILDNPWPAVSSLLSKRRLRLALPNGTAHRAQAGTHKSWHFHHHHLSPWGGFFSLATIWEDFVNDNNRGPRCSELFKFSSRDQSKTCGLSCQIQICRTETQKFA